MKNYFFIILSYSIILSSCLPKQKFVLKEGDLLFQDLDSSPLCDAIELVTPGYKDANFSHIGLVVLDNDTLKVLEASSKLMEVPFWDSINSSLLSMRIVSAVFVDFWNFFWS